MTNPPWPRLSRDELVTIISDYYKFLVKFYIPESSLKFPPPGGWPSITPKTTKGFPRSLLVIDILKHLPYIDEEHAGQMITHINYKCDVADYSTMTPEQWAKDSQWQADSVKEWIEELQEERESLKMRTKRKAICGTATKTETSQPTRKRIGMTVMKRWI